MSNAFSLFLGVSCYYCILRLLEGFIWLLFKALLILSVILGCFMYFID